MTVREGVFQHALEIALNAPLRSTRVRRINSGVLTVEGAQGRRVFRGAPAGTGDLVGFVGPDGRHVEVECKAHGGRLSTAQRRRGAALSAAGAVYVVVYGPHTLETLDAAVVVAIALVDGAITIARAGAGLVFPVEPRRRRRRA